MAAPTVEESSEIAAPETSAAPPSLWSRLRNSRFLFISILVHVLFGIGAAIYVVQVYNPQRKLTFTRSSVEVSAPSGCTQCCGRYPAAFVSTAHF